MVGAVLTKQERNIVDTLKAICDAEDTPKAISCVLSGVCGSIVYGNTREMAEHIIPLVRQTMKAIARERAQLNGPVC